MHSPVDCLNAMVDFIPKHTFQKLDLLCENLKVEYNKVVRIPKSIDDFVQFISDLTQLEAKFDNFTVDFQEVDQFNNFIEENHIKAPEKLKTKSKETNKLLIETRKKMEEGMQQGEVDRHKYKLELINKTVPMFKSEIEQNLEKLQDSRFADPEGSIDGLVSELNQLGEEIEALKLRGELINKQQVFFDLVETPFEEVTDLK